MQNFIFLQRKSPGVLQQMSGDFLFNKFLAPKYVIISPMREHKKFLKKDICITAGILGIASLVALLLQYCLYHALHKDMYVELSHR